jgi:hypothetical protein
VELFVNDAARSGHPLHVTRADQATGTGGVAVLKLAVVDDGHRFEPAVRVLADAHGGHWWGRSRGGRRSPAGTG